MLLWTHSETAILVVTVKEDKALENGRTLEMFVGELCKSCAVHIRSSTGALMLLGSELVTNSCASSVWCCCLSPSSFCETWRGWPRVQTVNTGWTAVLNYQLQRRNAEHNIYFPGKLLSENSMWVHSYCHSLSWNKVLLHNAFSTLSPQASGW